MARSRGLAYCLALKPGAHQCIEALPGTEQSLVVLRRCETLDDRAHEMGLRFRSAPERADRIPRGPVRFVGGSFRRLLESELLFDS